MVAGTIVLANQKVAEVVFTENSRSARQTTLKRCVKTNYCRWGHECIGHRLRAWKTLPCLDGCYRENAKIA